MDPQDQAGIDTQGQAESELHLNEAEAVRENIPLYQYESDQLSEKLKYKEYFNVPDSAKGWLYEYEQNLDQLLEQLQDSMLNSICEDDTALANGWSIDSVTITPNYVVMNCYYPECFSLDEHEGQTCCMVTGVILKDGTRIDCYSARNSWTFDQKNDCVFLEQASALTELLFNTSTVDAVCIRVWDPMTQEFSAAEETIYLLFDEQVDQYIQNGDIVVCDNDKLFASISDFYYFHNSHMYHLILRMINRTDSEITVSDFAAILNGVSIPDSGSYILAAGSEESFGLTLAEEEILSEGIGQIESVGIHFGVDFENGRYEHKDSEYTEEVSVYDINISEKTDIDIKEEFLRWRFTTNLNDRWTEYQAAIDELTEEAMNMEVPASAVPGIYVDPELEEKSEQIAAQYYSGISAIASEQFISQMAQNRMPMSEDSMYLEYGASMDFVDVTFGEGKEDLFDSGLVYDFDARVIVDGYERIPNYQYKQDEEGYFHMTGQITVEDGVVTKSYIAKQ